MNNLRFQEIPFKVTFFFFIKLNFFRKFIQCGIYDLREAWSPLVPSSTRKTTTFTCTVTPRIIFKGKEPEPSA